MMANCTDVQDEPIHKQEDELLPFELNYMPEFVLRKKENELNCIHADKQKCLQELKDLLNACQFSTVLPYRCPDGSVTVLSELGKLDPANISLETLKQIAYMTYQQALRNPVTQVTGFSIIDDFAGTGFQHLRYCKPFLMYLLNHITFAVLPARRMIFIHSTPEDLLNHFPRSALPVKYGGTLTDYYTADWLKRANEQQGNFPVGGQKNIF
ncbi:CRAL-TRIO domain-containing protein [Caerostris extrusa]|uniref:CRAL-TRIO domain-containing protein n=1 Tax=Caerostris extrusa TaxID=172846 RepID=A0AAV4RXN2_CAEEX|nr:CRAL-TRIO domain-containing protein [Caerostris extrusa]